MKKIYIYLFNGFSDWEIAYLTSEINKNPNFQLIYFSQAGEEIQSAGGLKIIPNESLENIDKSAIDAIILPGGPIWENSEYPDQLSRLVQEINQDKIPIGAICAATVFLGNLELLNNRIHTSNDLHYLEKSSLKYTGARYYRSNLVIKDDNLITASGIAPIEFAKELFKLIELYDEESIEKWYQLFKNGIWEP